jgi:hypothetical protein
VSTGFTLVEEDDVAFTLSLCREVHRIYGGYQDGSLTVDDSLKGGLLVTIEMLAALIGLIEGGMPSMRIAVAATQTREMLAVMFDEDPMQKPIADMLWGPRRPVVAPTTRPVLSAVASPAAEPVEQSETAPEALPAHVLAALEAPEEPSRRRRGWRLFRRNRR